MCNGAVNGGGGLDVYWGGGGDDPKTYMSVHLYILRPVLKLNI